MNRAERSRLASCLFSLVVIVLFSSSASAGWKEKVLYSFQGGSDGAVPAGRVVFDKRGYLYGATTGGGSTSCRGPFQCGTVYQLQPPATKGDPWTEKVLWVFKGSDGNDGASPFSGLVWDQAGNLYGATGYDGSGNCMLFGSRVGCGVVYQLKPPQTKGGAWTEAVIYNFQGGSDGQLPIGDLVFDAQGNLYGATEYGGGFGSCNAPFDQYCGTIFRLSPPKTKGGKWKEKVLYAFKSGKDGASPNGGLILDSKGAIYGTTYFGGNNQKGTCEGGVGGTGCGIVYKLSPPVSKGGPWTKKVLHLFKAQDGANSAAGVVFDGNGNLYGTTSDGPPNGFGLVFELKKPSGKVHSWAETVLYQFTNGSDGAYPMAGLSFDAGGSLYGTALGGATHRGVVFRLKAPKNGNAWPFTVLYNLKGSPDGDHPTAGLGSDRRGNLYSTTQWGGTGESCQGGCGTVFEVRAVGPRKSSPIHRIP
jgi:hypothetical protein